MADPGRRPPGPEPDFRAFLIFRKKREGGTFLFSRACKGLYRRRFKEIEKCAAAAYRIAYAWAAPIKFLCKKNLFSASSIKLNQLLC